MRWCVRIGGRYLSIDHTRDMASRMKWFTDVSEVRKAASGWHGSIIWTEREFEANELQYEILRQLADAADLC